MSATVDTPVDDDAIFDAASYVQRPVPELDGHRAIDLALRFSGAGKLDRTRDDDLALAEAARLGCEVRLIVVGTVNSKTFRLSTKPDGDELSFSCTVSVSSVEAAELA